ncbi:hypothetical protein LXL04_033931 [Taraxacum kok-saghyz]
MANSISSLIVLIDDSPSTVRDLKPVGPMLNSVQGFITGYNKQDPDIQASTSLDLEDNKYVKCDFSVTYIHVILMVAEDGLISKMVTAVTINVDKPLEHYWENSIWTIIIRNNSYRGHYRNSAAVWGCFGYLLLSMFRRCPESIMQQWGQFGHSARPESIMQQWGYFWKTVQAWRWNLQKHNQWSSNGEIFDRSVFRNETIRRIKLSPAHRAGTPLITTTCHHGKVAGDDLALPEKSRKHNEEFSHGLTAARGEKGGTDLCPSNLIYATPHQEGGIMAVQPARSPEKSSTPSRNLPIH